jgi:GNAT superfamily N-acetyltransferase
LIGSYAIISALPFRQVILIGALMPDIIIETALKSDLRQILELQKEAYISEAQIYSNFKIPPLTETFDEFEKAFEDQIVLKAEKQGTLVGSVRAFETKSVCQIGRLIVKQSHRNLGYGARLLHEIESRFPQAVKYELFTGDKSRKNLHLYTKNGYRIVRRHQVSESLTLVFLHKFNTLTASR